MASIVTTDAYVQYSVLSPRLPPRAAPSSNAISQRASLPTRLTGATRGGSGTVPFQLGSQISHAHGSTTPSPCMTTRSTGLAAASHEFWTAPPSPLAQSRRRTICSPRAASRDSTIGQSPLPMRSIPQAPSQMHSQAPPQVVHRSVIGTPRSSLGRGTSRDSRGCSSTREGSMDSHQGGGFRSPMRDAIRVRPPSPHGLSWLNDADMDSDPLWAARRTPIMSCTPRTASPSAGAPRDVVWERPQGGSLTPKVEKRLPLQSSAQQRATSRLDTDRSRDASRSMSTDSRIGSRSVSQSSRVPSYQRPSSIKRGSATSTTTASGSLSTSTRNSCWEMQPNWKTPRHSAASQAKAQRPSSPLSSRSTSRPRSPTATTPAGPCRHQSPGKEAGAQSKARTSSGLGLRLSGQTRTRCGYESPLTSSRAAGGSLLNRTKRDQVKGVPRAASNQPQRKTEISAKSPPPYAQGVMQHVQRRGASRTQNTDRSVSNARAKARSKSRDVEATSVDLLMGAEVNIDGCICKVTGALGMGSFGTVWAAEEISTQAKLAIKEIPCLGQNELMNALFERHLLDILSERPDLSQHAAPPAGPPARLPALIGHEVVHGNPQRVRLAMTRVPGFALEDFLEDRRCEAAESLAAGAAPSARHRFSEAVLYGHELLAQLAPVLERISTTAIHRDVNTQNILIDAENLVAPSFGLVDFGLAVDTECWCSSEDNPDTRCRPTRLGLDGVQTWRYLDIAGDCRYWPVSAWTQFLIGWKDIDADACLRREYQVQLDQHALGITAMKVFTELLSPPPPKEPRDGHGCSEEQGSSDSYGSVKSSEVANLQVELWKILRAWERYWKRIAPIHKKLISTFHHGGDWEVLKRMCKDRNFYDNLGRDLKALRDALQEAASAAYLVVSSKESGPEDTALLAKSARLFQAMLVLVSDGATPDMPYGPGAWNLISRILSTTDLNGADSSELPTASCSSTASTAEAPPDRKKEFGAKGFEAIYPS